MARILLHVGYHKTGHQWLRDALFEDPATGYGLISKESTPVRRLVRDRPLDFDPSALRGEFEPLVKKVEGKGLVPVLCWGRLAGQAFSAGYDSKEIADRLRAVFPGARILIVVREQRSMIVSTYKQYVLTGGVCTLDHFLHPATERGLRVPGFDFRYFEYHRLIDHYHSLFGRDAVLVVPFEELVRDRGAFVSTVAEFGGRPVNGEALERVLEKKASNRARSALELPARRRVNRFGPRTELNPAPLFESQRIFALGGRMPKQRHLLSSPRTRAVTERAEQRLRRKVAKIVGDRYVESNRATAELTGVDLASYGWML